ncbi:MAG: CDP-alcohol phosphatidyltransferase family protein [Oscillospiraceae bacterium]|nr:CDP-alcohol phosphatidyltransferase family protein [Oscillospiraceae bacterium]
MPTPLKKFLTIPNVISIVRIAMIPAFVWAFMTGRDILALALVVVSGVSDKLDGAIARRFNMVSEAGKWLDPMADKFTQVALALILFLRFHASADAWMRAFSWVFLGFIGKEVFMLLFALFMLIIGKRPGAAEIWGKAATVVFYVVMGVLLFAGPEVGVLPRYIPEAVLPRLAVQILVVGALVVTVMAFLGYIPDTYRKLFKEGKEK